MLCQMLISTILPDGIALNKRSRLVLVESADSRFQFFTKVFPGAIADVHKEMQVL
jgi:hypothetical protein